MTTHSERDGGKGAAMRHRASPDDSTADRIDPARRDRVARLNARAASLRSRVLEIQAEYEAGRIPLDQELAQFREIARELREIGAQLRDLACDESESAPDMPR